MVKWNNEYQVYVSDDGRVFRADMYEYAHHINKRYHRVQIMVHGKRKTLGIHRLVYLTFIGNIPPNMEIDHIDRNPENNYVLNLRCVTRKENCNNRNRKSKVKKYTYSEFGRKFFEHFGLTHRDNHALYSKEAHWYHRHGKCSWE